MKTQSAKCRAGGRPVTDHMYTICGWRSQRLLLSHWKDFWKQWAVSGRRGPLGSMEGGFNRGDAEQAGSRGNDSRPLAFGIQSAPKRSL
jgi:hypothetical protein